MSRRDVFFFKMARYKCTEVGCTFAGVCDKTAVKEKVIDHIMLDDDRVYYPNYDHKVEIEHFTEART